MVRLTEKSYSPSHIETSQLICFANQLAGFYMTATLSFDGLIQLNSPHS